MASVYDVFISHCGKDCKLDYAILLRAKLEQAGIRCFFDDKDLLLGDNAEEKMLSAMQTARIGLVILSRGFFTRQWCMKELQTFVDRGNLFPVFLAIKPDDLGFMFSPLSEEWGTFPISRKEYQRLIDAAAKITGLRAQGGSWDESMLRVRKDLLRRLDRLEGGPRLSDSSKKLFGLEQHMVNLKQLLGVPYEQLTESSASGRGAPLASSREIGIVAGIKGMGGIGKSTLAKQIADDRAAREFFSGGICWVEVNQSPSDDHICKLQQQIIREVCGVEEYIHNPRQGASKIKCRLRGKRVLIILDNIWEAQGSSGVVTLDCLEAGSCILKTTRDGKTLGAKGVQYDLNVLDSQAAWELFCWHAFSRTT
jgi:hypothetical protein